MSLAGQIFELAWKTMPLAAVALGAILGMRKRSSSEKASIAAAGLVTCMLLPIVANLVPSLAVPLPAPKVATGTWLLAAYLLISAWLLLRLALSLIRLVRLSRRARTLDDARWRSALDRCARHFAASRAPVVRVSDEISSPLSWGLFRPVVIIDPTTLASPSAADFILAHELAHIVRYDWLQLILSRVATALIWFNPFVWLLARMHSILAEEAADDLVLRTGANRHDYARVLVEYSGRRNSERVSPANGVLSLDTSLGQRISRLLDGSRRRTPARMAFISAVHALAVIATAPIAALSLAGPSGNGDGVQGDPTLARVDSAGSIASSLPISELDPRAWDWAAALGEQAAKEAVSWDWAVDPCQKSIAAGLQRT
jgi:beta-lactamase regulating signal transducer with metallopeptidase domain